MSNESSDYRRSAALGAVVTLPEVYETAGRLSIADRRLLIDQALVLFDEFYVHLPLKRAMYAIDPIQRLKLLRRRAEQIDNELDFHNELLQIFVSIRDLHTNYVLPAPYNQMFAVLPFAIDEYYDNNGTPQYLIKSISPFFLQLTSIVLPDDFRPEVHLTHWNGVPMERTVARNADRQPGTWRQPGSSPCPRPTETYPAASCDLYAAGRRVG